MKNSITFGVIAGLAIIVIMGLGGAQTSSIPQRAQAQSPSLDATLANLWQLNGNSLFPRLTSWNVGIGTKTPTSKLTVAGTIESTTGGFKFPDGTVQQTAQLVGPQGPIGPEGPAGQQLHLFDGNNQDLGIVVFASANKYTTYSFDQGGFFFDFIGGKLTTLQLPHLYYTELDCVGSPYVTDYYGLPLPKEILLSIPLQQYFSIPGGSIFLTAKSTKDNVGACDNFGNSSGNYWLLQPFTLPFSPPSGSLHLGY